MSDSSTQDSPDKKYKIIVLISGNGSNLQNIIDHIQAGTINATIAAVISNRADAFGLDRAKKADIDTQILDHIQFETREAFDSELRLLIDSYSPDLIVMAGFMRILSDGFVKHYAGKMINIHPSLLPLYKGLHTHQRALADKQSEHGASVHFVIPELDAGKVIIQGVVDVEDNDDEESLRNRVRKIEHQIYLKAVKVLAEGHMEFIDGELFYDGKLMKKPLRERLE